METVITMSQEGMEWCISIAKDMEIQEFGDVIYLTTVDAYRVSISTKAQEYMVDNHLHLCLNSQIQNCNV